MNIDLLRRLRTVDETFPAAFSLIRAWDAARDQQINEEVSAIIADVRKHGDAALLRYTQRFDRVQVESIDALVLQREDMKSSWQRLPESDRVSLEQAAQRIRDFHKHQLQASWSITDSLGNQLGQRVIPIERVGVYAPGGQAAYPSTVLMTAIPARVAGVSSIVVTVPTPDGVRNDAVLGAAHLAGVDQVVCVGGAQAIAALAYGTQTIPRVDKIVGPGSAYVAAAKRMVFGAVGIDMVAGPSEVVIVADGTAPARWIALDLLSQAEHDELAQSILLSPSASYLSDVHDQIVALLPTMSRRAIIERSLSGRGALIQTRDLDEAVTLANAIAPEHLELAVHDPRALLEKVRHAGAVFLGSRSSEVLGDYVAGPSHVLPTFGTARFSSPLGVYDFVRRMSVIEISESGADELGKHAVALAEGEGLTAHAAAAHARMRAADNQRLT